MAALRRWGQQGQPGGEHCTGEWIGIHEPSQDPGVGLVAPGLGQTQDGIRWPRSLWSGLAPLRSSPRTLLCMWLSVGFAPVLSELSWGPPFPPTMGRKGGWCVCLGQWEEGLRAGSAEQARIPACSLAERRRWAEPQPGPATQSRYSFSTPRNAVLTASLHPRRRGHLQSKTLPQGTLNKVNYFFKFTRLNLVF